jgi:hypothetical protein
MHFLDGHRFAEVEVVSALTALTTRYTIHLTEKMEQEFARQNLTMEQKIEKLLKSTFLLTTT